MPSSALLVRYLIYRQATWDISPLARWWRSRRKGHIVDGDEVEVEEEVTSDSAAMKLYEICIGILLWNDGDV